MSCLFCDIVSRRMQTEFVFEDGRVVVIPDIRPVQPGHVLIVPKEHFCGISDLPPTLFGHMCTLAHRFAAALSRAFPSATGINILISEGVSANQSIFHSHLHVIPRKEGDSMLLSSSDPVASNRDLLMSAQQWRTALAEGLE